jgi:aldose 1-epimerase
MAAGISEIKIGTLPDGREIKKFCLRNAQGAQASFLNLGASWIAFKLSEHEPSLVLGSTNLAAFINQQAYLGATIGRYANRIRNGRFSLNNQIIQLDKNQSPHHIHGGRDGISFKVWHSHIRLEDNRPILSLHCLSKDGESGFPGNVDINLTISLTESNGVRFHYKASTDKPTIINLTNHAYFNLDGYRLGHLNNHEFKLYSSTYLDTDASGIPTGLLINACDDSALNLTQWKNINTELSELTEPQLALCEGYDHCFCYENDNQLKTMAAARSRVSGRQLICRSNLPGMQFYTANFLQGTHIGDGECYKRHGAFCFEPGFWTDSPNHAHFPDCSIDADNGYSAIIEYSFSESE